MCYPERTFSRKKYVYFWLMLFISSTFFQFVGVEGFITFLTDMYPNVFRRGYRREMLIGVVCGICFLIGLSMVTEVRTAPTIANLIP